MHVTYLQDTCLLLPKYLHPNAASFEVQEGGTITNSQVLHTHLYLRKLHNREHDNSERGQSFLASRAQHLLDSEIQSHRLLLFQESIILSPTVHYTTQKNSTFEDFLSGRHPLKAPGQEHVEGAFHHRFALGIVQNGDHLHIESSSQLLC